MKAVQIRHIRYYIKPLIVKSMDIATNTCDDKKGKSIRAYLFTVMYSF